MISYDVKKVSNSSGQRRGSAAANLAVPYRAVDLGANDGLQFEPSGGTLAVPVVVNTWSSAGTAYKLVSFQGKVSEERFREVYTSKFRKVRIYEVVNVSQKSRQWLADPENRMCDAPGSWYCPGQYPPALAKFTGIIKPAYRMPAFAKQQIEERARREAEKKEAAAQKAAEKKAADELRKATDGQAAHEDL